MSVVNWDQLAKDVVDHKKTEFVDYREANADMIRNTVAGMGPHATSSAGDGVRVACNISTAHVPSLVLRSANAATKSRAYMNRYDLQATRTLGSGLPPNPPKPGLRERVDDAVLEACWPVPTPQKQDIYYGALELNGTGIRYFGDACLVLKTSAIDRKQPVLYRNSFDISTKPVVDKIYVPSDPAQTHSNAVTEFQSWTGQWSSSVSHMVVCKIMEGRPDTQRRLTTGTISQGILFDEDYIEIPKLNSFHTGDVEECRFSSADAAKEAYIGDRMLHGPTPTMAELMWRHRRRVAEHVLENGASPVPVRVVSTVGRDRG